MSNHNVRQPSIESDRNSIHDEAGNYIGVLIEVVALVTNSTECSQDCYSSKITDGSNQTFTKGIGINFCSKPPSLRMY